MKLLFVRKSWKLWEKMLCLTTACVTNIITLLGSILPTCLWTVFMHKDPKSEKRQSSHQCLFALLGSAYSKAAGKMLLNLTPGFNFINILCSAFTSADPKSVKKTVRLSIFFMLLGSTSIKAVRKTLLKLTPDFVAHLIGQVDSSQWCLSLFSHSPRANPIQKIVLKSTFILWQSITPD